MVFILFPQSYAVDYVTFADVFCQSDKFTKPIKYFEQYVQVFLELWVNRI